MFHMTVSLFADFLLWGSIPLWAILGFWEEHLKLSNAGHEIAQIILVCLVLGWAYMWNRIGERDRLAHRQSQNPKQPIKLHFESEIHPDQDSDLFSGENTAHQKIRESGFVEILEKPHVSKN